MHAYDVMASGQTVAKRIEAADGVVETRFCAVKAMNGDVTFGAGCTVAQGDAPAEDDVLQQGDMLLMPFTAIEVKVGVLYAWEAPVGIRL